MLDAGDLILRSKTGMAVTVLVVVALVLLLYTFWEKRRTPGCGNPFGTSWELAVFMSGYSTTVSLFCLLVAALASTV